MIALGNGLAYLGTAALFGVILFAMIRSRRT